MPRDFAAADKGGRALKGSTKIAIATNFCLAALLLAVGLVCFLPQGQVLRSIKIQAGYPRAPLRPRILIAGK